jgi:hypothetical protein
LITRKLWRFEDCIEVFVDVMYAEISARQPATRNFRSPLGLCAFPDRVPSCPECPTALAHARRLRQQLIAHARRVEGAWRRRKAG